jgi:hypothetical protein
VIPVAVQLTSKRAKSACPWSPGGVSKRTTTGHWGAAGPGRRRPSGSNSRQSSPTRRAPDVRGHERRFLESRPDPLSVGLELRGARRTVIPRRGGLAQVSPDGLPVQAQLASDLGDRAAQGTEPVDDEVILLSDHGFSSAGPRRLLRRRNVTESLGARHLFAREFSIATNGKLIIGSDTPPNLTPP